MCTWGHRCRIQRRGSIILELEEQVFVRHYMWVLGTKLEISARTGSTVNH